ncbi:hypothetical protein K0M31_010339, partial [Melipona bicolor]
MYLIPIHKPKNRLSVLERLKTLAKRGRRKVEESLKSLPIYSRPVEFPRRFPGVHRFGNRCRALAGWYAAALSSPALCKPCVYTSVAS